MVSWTHRHHDINSCWPVYMFWGKRHYFTVINLVLELFTIQRSNIIWDVPRILCHACSHEKKKFKNSKPIKKEIVNSTKNFKLCENDKKELKDHLQNEKKKPHRFSCTGHTENKIPTTKSLTLCSLNNFKTRNGNNLIKTAEAFKAML